MESADPGRIMKQARELFSRARRLPPGAEREKFLDDACHNEQDLRNEVDSLLSAELKACRFLQNDAMGTPLGKSGELLGCTIDRYHLVEHLGEGGFGDVYRVIKVKPVARELAMKIIKPGMVDREFEARFLNERKVLELMDHPNIAQIFDAGRTDDGRSYFIMELVIGVPITTYCDNKTLSIRERLGLFNRVCKAVNYAHQKGILHRDLKPSNIVVVESEGVAIPKIIDFGIAKALMGELKESSLVTQVGLFVGTPAYMSPEQIRFSSENLDIRLDVYALGVLLYELVVGTHLYDNLQGLTLAELQHVICNHEPDKPSTRLKKTGVHAKIIAEKRSASTMSLTRTLRGDLDWIVMKAIEKDRTLRYQAADELALDIQRHLDNDPVEAGAPGRIYRLRKYLKRHLVAANVLAIVIPVLIIAVTFSLVGFFKAKHERLLALGNLYESNIHLAYENWKTGQIGQVKRLLASLIPEGGEPDLRNWEWYYLLSLCYQDTRTIQAHGNEIELIALSPDGTRLASVDVKGKTRIWDTASWAAIAELPGFGGPVMGNYFVAWSPDGRLLAMNGEKGICSLWDTDTWTIVQTLNSEFMINQISWSPDGERIVMSEWSLAGMDSTPAINAWDPLTGKKTGSFKTENPVEQVQAIAWSPDSTVIVGGCGNGKLYFWDADTHERMFSIVAHSGGIRKLSWSPDSQRIAVASEDTGFSIWERGPWKERKRIRSAHQGVIDIVKWSIDGSKLVSSGYDGKVKIWDALSGDLLQSLTGHNGFCAASDWEEKGGPIYSVSKGGLISQWSLSKLEAWHDTENVGGLAFHPDGKLLATALLPSSGSSQLIDKLTYSKIRILDLPFANPVKEFSLQNEPVVVAFAWSNDERYIAVATYPNGDQATIRVIDMDRDEIVFEDTTTAVITSIDWDPSGNLLACCVDHRIEDTTDEIIIWDVSVGRRKRGFKGHDECGSMSYFTSIEWHPDGGKIAAACAINHVLVLDVESGNLMHSFSGNERANAGVQNKLAWSPTGDRLCSGFGDGSILVWDTGTGKLLKTLTGHADNAISLSWSPDSKRIMSLSRDQTIRIWNPDTGRELLQLPMPINDFSNPSPSIRWSPDGYQIAAVASRKLRIFDATIGYDLANSQAAADFPLK